MSSHKKWGWLSYISVFVLAVGVTNAGITPVIAEVPDNPDATQDVTTNVPSNLSLSVKDSTTSDFGGAMANKENKVNDSTWHAFSNHHGSDTSSTVTFYIEPFINQSESGIKRKAKIEIKNADGGWATGSDGQNTADPGAETTYTSVSTGNVDLPDPGNGNGLGKKPLNGELEVDVWFQFADADEKPSTGEYLAPEGDYKTTITGTISAN